MESPMRRAGLFVTGCVTVGLIAAGSVCANIADTLPLTVSVVPSELPDYAASVHATSTDRPPPPLLVSSVAAPLALPLPLLPCTAETIPTTTNAVMPLALPTLISCVSGGLVLLLASLLARLRSRWKSETLHGAAERTRILQRVATLEEELAVQSDQAHTYATLWESVTLEGQEGDRQRAAALRDADEAHERCEALTRAVEEHQQRCALVERDLEHHREQVAALTRAVEESRRACAAMTEAERQRAAAPAPKKVWRTLDDVAFETSRLALAAAMEAARAAGPSPGATTPSRGWSHVAREMRSLAHRTREAAKRLYPLSG